MNYQHIHDLIISRAKSRQKDNTKYQNHHIIPIHEDPFSTETVPVTLKEHRILHLLRWKFVGSLGNKIAYNLMKGFTSIDVQLEVCSIAGKLGGKVTKDNKLGIFSDEWDRSSETKNRWRTGIINVDMFNGYEHCSMAGKVTKDNKLGIFSDEWDRSSASKKIWDDLSVSERQYRAEKNAEYAAMGGQKSKELGTNFTSWDKEKHKAVCSKGGKTAGKIPMWTDGVINKRSYTCPGEGFRRGMTLHNKRKQGVIDE
jgi:hypothetical protein